MSDRGKAINEMACGYLAANGMPEYGTDQAANFWLGHLATFGLRVAERFATDRDAVLEEAARVCESIAAEAVDLTVTDKVPAASLCGLVTRGYVNGARFCRAAIRALNATPAPITPSAVDEAERRGAERERAAVVEWARAEAVKCDGICDMIAAQFAMRLPSDGRWWRAFADRVEAGRHIPPATESEGSSK